ncbi:MAG: DUF1684 domain-containing protein, partial [Candidatus Limnocylindria bacterium]
PFSCMMTEPMPHPTSDHLALADWRRQVAELYAELRADTRAGPMRAVAFRSARDRLFGSHPSSAIPEAERRDFHGLAYFRHDQALALRARFEPDPEAAALDVPRSGEGPQIPMGRIGWVRFAVDGTPCRLSVFWLNEYSGGIFIPFRDATTGRETYGGGRYLWDSAKGADLGIVGDELNLDFNYAYHPSCVYDPIWSCPLAPQENWLPVPINAGERLPESKRR